MGYILLGGLKMSNYMDIANIILMMGLLFWIAYDFVKNNITWRTYLLAFVAGLLSSSIFALI